MSYTNKSLTRRIHSLIDDAAQHTRYAAHTHLWNGQEDKQLKSVARTNLVLARNYRLDRAKELAR